MCVRFKAEIAYYPRELPLAALGPGTLLLVEMYRNIAPLPLCLFRRVSPA